MNSQMIETIEHRMMTHLDAHQQKILHDTLCQCLEEERLKANDDDNQNFVKVFLAAKRVEGCSEKTVPPWILRCTTPMKRVWKMKNK